ncbi:hypothetical protein ACOME3_004848 [Neoechinorhynchus agilis]
MANRLIEESGYKIKTLNRNHSPIPSFQCGDKWGVWSVGIEILRGDGLTTHKNQRRSQTKELPHPTLECGYSTGQHGKRDNNGPMELRGMRDIMKTKGLNAGKKVYLIYGLTRRIFFQRKIVNFHLFFNKWLID